MTISHKIPDHFGLECAGHAAKNAQCRRRSVGAVTFSKDGMLIRAGWNGGPEDEPGCLEGACPRGLKSPSEHPGYDQGNHDYSDCIATHAEVRAGDVADGTMFITAAPCNGCMTFIENSRLRRAVWPGGEWNRSAA